MVLLNKVKASFVSVAVAKSDQTFKVKSLVGISLYQGQAQCSAGRGNTQPKEHYCVFYLSPSTFHGVSVRSQ
jgi:hypothetical protein